MTKQPSFREVSVDTLKLTALLLPLALVSCAKSDAAQANERQVLPSLRAASTPSTLSVKLIHRVRSAPEIGDKAAALLGILRPNTATLAEVRSAASAAARLNGNVHFAPASFPGLVVSYREDDDDLSVEDEIVRGEHTTATDVGEADALIRFQSTVDAVVAAGLVQAFELDRQSPQRSKIMESEFSAGSPVVTRVREYEFTAPRVRAGVPVHEAGVTVSVHRTGALARIKISGPSFVGDGPSDATMPPVGHRAADAKVAAAYPSAKIVPIGLRYWLRPGEAKAASVPVLPQYLYSVYQTLPAKQDGKNLLAQGITVAVSSVDKDAELVISPDLTEDAAPSDRKPQPDPRP
jgi:hypothetical protein